MARLVIGTNKTATTPALVKEVGIVPAGTINITSNGTTDVTQYASANVNVTPTLCMQYRNVNGELKRPNTFIDLTGITDITEDYLFAYAFYYDTSISTINLSRVENVDGYKTFYECFYSCTGLTSVDLSSLVTANGNECFSNAFAFCSGITSIDLSSLTHISAYCFNATFAGTGVTSVVFNSLTEIEGYGLAAAFQDCRYLTSLSFPALTSSSFVDGKTSQFDYMLGEVTGCTIHFPSNLQATIATLDGYPDFGGTNTVLAFDLPATE